MITGGAGFIGSALSAHLQSKGHEVFVVFADEERTTVTPELVHHRHKITPYAGESLRGAVHATYVRGMKVAERGRVLASEQGVLL